MRWVKGVLVTLVSASATACAGPGFERMRMTLIPKTEGGPTVAQSRADACPDKPAGMFFADPVCVKFPVGAGGAFVDAATADAAAGNKQKHDFVFYAMQDARTKCLRLVSSVTGAQVAENTTLDVAGLVLSGLATVFTPASTVRALSAASTAAQGTKQAFNADIYQQMTMVLLVQQIKTTYFSPMTVIISAYPANIADWSNISAAAELSKIQSLQLNCSIPFAAANMTATQAGAQTTSPSPAPPKWVVSISGTVTNGDIVTLTASSASVPAFSAQVAYTLAVPADTLDSIKRQLMSKIYLNNQLALATVVAGFSPGDTTSNPQFLIIGGPADIQWTPTVSGAMTEKVTPTKSAN